MPDPVPRRLADLSATDSLAAAVAATGDAALEVPSPSFTLVQSYDTRRGTVHHFDLWRLDGPAALAELGWDDARDDIVLVEWPDRLGALAPSDALRLDFTLGEADARVVTVSGWSDRLVLAD